MKVFSVIGYSKTGKTTVATKLISMLNKRDFRVAAIKDIHFESFTMEREGSNSHLMQLAGAEAIIARGLRETFFIKPQRMELMDMISMFNTEWLVIEGMKREAIPKILTVENEEQLEELLDDTVMAISGKISNRLNDYKGIPVINIKEHPEKILSIVEEKVFNVLPLAKKECCGACGLSCYEMVGAILKGEKKREDCVLSKKQRITLKINGEHIKLVPFVAKILFDLLQAFTSNLKGYKKGKIEVEMDNSSDYR